MISRILIALGLVASIFAASSAFAQAQNSSDELVSMLASLARENITSARLEDGSYVAPETPEELAQPILPRELEAIIVARGALSGQLSHCEIDWVETNYLPLMQQMRSQGWAGKEMAYAGLLHGAALGMAQDAFSNAGTSCDEATVANLRLIIQSPMEALPSRQN